RPSVSPPRLLLRAAEAALSPIAGEGLVGPSESARLPREDHPLWARDLDAVLAERGEEALPQLARRGPLVRGAHGPQDLQGHAVLAERGAPIPPRPLEHPPVP